VNESLGTIECSIDGEWRSDVDIKRCGAYRYFESPYCLPLILCWSIDRAPVRTWTIHGDRRCPPDLAEHIQSGGLIRAFNAAFERLGFRWLAAHWGWPEPRLEQYRCTAVEGAAMSLPRRLDKIGDALGIAAKKDKRGDKLIKLFSIPRKEPGSERDVLRRSNAMDGNHGRGSTLGADGEDKKAPPWNEPRDYPAEFAEFIEYCRQDVRAEQEVASRLIPLSAAEWEVYALNERINDRGLRIDVRSARAAIALVGKAKTEIDREIADVTGGAVTAVTQVARLKSWIATQGLVLPSLDKETIDDSLHDDHELHPAVRRALELRAEGAKPSIEKIAGMARSAGEGGRVRGVYLHHGAGQTGRFSSRGGIQAHNMPKYRKIFEDAHLDLGELFDAIRSERPDVLRDRYGPELGRPLHLISDAVRSFIWADPGKEFLVADYSSIEGVLAAWSTGEEWELEAYRKAFAGTGPGVYEINAAAMFGVPVEQVTKLQRRGGKIQVLSCQYATGPNGILKFARHEGIKLAPLFDGLWAAADAKRRAGAERRRASREKRNDPVLAARGREAWLAAELTKVSYRAQHPRVEAAWGSLEDSAIGAIRSPGTVMRPNGVTGVAFVVRQGFLWLQLPSGRCLAYGRPKLHAQVYTRIPLEDGSWSDSERMDLHDAQALASKGLCKIEGECKPKIIVSGTDSQSETWKRFPIYGGSLFNNCLSGETNILTPNGFKRMLDVTTEDLVWDGVSWVRHQGLAYQGRRRTIQILDVEMTSEHEVWTNDGWFRADSVDIEAAKTASSLPDQNRATVRIFDRNSIRREHRQEEPMARGMFMWKRGNNSRLRVDTRASSKLRLSEERTHQQKSHYAWKIISFSIPSLAKYAGSMQSRISLRLSKLWGPGNHCLRALENVQHLLRRHGANVEKRATTGTHAKQRRVFAGKLCLGESNRPDSKQAQQQTDRYTERKNALGGSSRSVSYQRDDAMLPARSRMANREPIRPSESWTQTYDLINAGPRHRFTIKCGDGTIIVSNCIQGMARDVLVHGMQKAEAAGFEVNLQTHDEIGCEIWRGSADPAWFERLICELSSWCTGLPLNAKAFVSKRYKKD
jgi:DNA polymerase bacteriophage-type